MGVLVQKYGGTSVGSPERIQRVAERIERSRTDGRGLVVVVSAMGQTTDELIALAHRVSQSPSHREMDMLLTAGERISMALLSMALTDRGLRALSLTGSQSGIITDASHRRAKIRRILGDRIRQALAADQVAIIAGFQGVSETKEITTLGRGGSDTTAVALAASLGADACEIYTDVDGVYSADPRLVPEARLWTRIPHDLMIQYAWLGAGVLHPRSVELAAQHGVSLWVKNSLNDEKGTEIMAKESVTAASASSRGLEEFEIIGITACDEKILLEVELMRNSLYSAVLDAATAHNLSLTAPIFSGTRLQCFVEREALDAWKRILQRMSEDGFAASFSLQEDQVPVSVVGYRFAQDGRALSQIMDTLAQEQISVTMGSASALSATLAVRRNCADDAVKALHQHFFSPEGKSL